MNQSIQLLKDALKKILLQLKPQSNALSFLLVVGKTHQGKTAFLRQAGLHYEIVNTEPHAEIYYNQHGVLVELSQDWLNQKELLTQALKQLNRAHRALKITGIMLCIDINALFHTEPSQFMSEIKSHANLLEQFGLSLGYKTNVAIIFTKLDALAGFCDFFQNDHANDLSKPLGFSLYGISVRNKLIETYKTQFEYFIETLGQQVINKMHPVRSTIKRSLIREFPLQLATLRMAIQTIIQHISLNIFNIQTLYFTSAEQGGLSLDRLSNKIQNEYALVVEDTFQQATNYRTYFIEGALESFQKQTKCAILKTIQMNHWQIGSIAAITALLSMGLIYQYMRSSALLDETKQELLSYDVLSQQNGKRDLALYHLAEASSMLEGVSGKLFSPTLTQLKNRLNQSTQHDLEDNFLPNRLVELEQVMTNNQLSELERYQALKVYLMLNDPHKYVEQDVVAWFKSYWQKNTQMNLDKNLKLLVKALKQPFVAMPINQQLVMDVRNYMNALPVDYLYYGLAKTHFDEQKEPITIEGFALGDKAIPTYFTKAGFQKIITQLPSIAAELEKENWVLGRTELGNLQTLLQQTYCHEYVVWWENFLNRSNPLHAQNYQQAHFLAQTLYQSQSIARLIEIVQQNTGPELKDHAQLFNQTIANHFSALNLISRSGIQNLHETFDELEKFLTTLSIINDQGKTAFSLVRSRFSNDDVANPLSALYNQARQMPEPIASWAKQIANDTWYLLVTESRAYINQQWKQTVYNDYINTISHRFPFDSTQTQDIAINDFNRFFAPHGTLNQFVETYLKPFLDTSKPQWQPKEVNNSVMPISEEMISELIRANIINNMFFPDGQQTSTIEFSLQKITLDPVVSNLQLSIGSTLLQDTQSSDSVIAFHWPESDAKLSLNSIEGNHFELAEQGPWAFFKILQKVNVLIDEENSTNLQILFEINGNSGRYLLKTQNEINPFTPGILNGFNLKETIV